MYYTFHQRCFPATHHAGINHVIDNNYDTLDTLFEKGPSISGHFNLNMNER
jgi:hypothetical protein